MTREEAIKRLKTTDACDSELCESLEMAIKALEQQPTDVISRQAAIDTLTKTSGIRGDALKALYDLPSVSPMQKWIPVSERLPDKYTYTLWCASSGYVRSDYFNGEVWEDAKKYCYEVVAWMPLPEPYVPDINIGKMSEIPIVAEGSEKE